MKFPNTIKLLAALILSITIFSCKNDRAGSSAPSVLKANLYIRYLADDNSVKAEAVFLESSSDTAVRPKDFDNVVFQGRPMDARDLGDRGIRFSAEISEAYAGDYFFEFGDKGAEKRTVKISMPALDAFDFEGKVSKSAGAKLNLAGAVFSNTESLVLLFSDKNNQTGAVEIPNLSGMKNLQILPQALISLHPGENDVYLVKKQNRQFSENGVAVNATIEFYTKTKKVMVEE